MKETKKLCCYMWENISEKYKEQKKRPGGTSKVKW